MTFLLLYTHPRAEMTAHFTAPGTRCLALGGSRSLELL